MTRKLYWLAFKVGDEYKLSSYRCDTREQAIHHGLKHVLDRELVAAPEEMTSQGWVPCLDLNQPFRRHGDEAPHCSRCSRCHYRRPPSVRLRQLLRPKGPQALPRCPGLPQLR